MILEIACIEVESDLHAEFEAAVDRAVAEVLSQSSGFLGITVLRGMEQPEAYQLHIRWEALEDHTIGFRESERFAAWRAIIGGFFVAPPAVAHWSIP